MQTSMLVLQPTFDAAADPIALLAALTPIGRDHPQIVRYGEAYLGALETRHARIILEQEAPILLDLSESGTTLRNGEPVGAGPVPVSEGDVLKFGDALEFQVQVLHTSDPEATRMLTQPKPVVQLLLTPVAQQGPDAAIAITEFPFLIASADGHFATYQATLPEPVSFLSRRHAHIYLNDETLLLEDLGSTNGTAHNGEALGQQAVALASGDQVRFGHRHFTFEVAVTVEQASDVVTQRALPDGTVMISSAGSFLDVYCDDADAAGKDSGDTGTDLDAAVESRGWLQPDLAALSRVARLRWQQWPYLRARQIAAFVLLPAVALALTAVLLTRDTRMVRAQALLDDGEPQAALAIAADYAREHGQQAQAQQLLESAFEEALLPGWIERMESRQPQAARDYLQQQAQIAPGLADGRTVALLDWMTALESLMSGADGTATVSVANDNRALQTLANQWRDQADQYTRLLRRFTDSYPALGPVHTRAMSSIRAIQGDGADQLKAVAALHERMTELLAQSQFDSAATELARFATAHPNIQDQESFAADLAQLATIDQLRKGQNLEQFLEQTKELDFASSFFARSKSALALERRQALDVRDQQVQATTLWQAGQLQPALTTLSVTEGNPWSDLLEQQHRRYDRLQQGFSNLLAQVGTSEYPDAVIDFYAQLDPTEDTFMRTALADDFSNQRDRAVSNAEQLAASGAKLWSDYSQTFQGIGGGLRLEATVSQTYRELAQQLTQSVTVLGQAHRLFALLELEIPAVLAEQHADARQEVIRQRSAVASLRSVLGEEVVREKLDLLPVVEAAHE